MTELWRRQYPFASHWMPLGSDRLHYVDEGAGKPLLMSHGNPTWSFYWRRLISPLSTEYRALAVDHIGCGLSDKPQRYPYCLQRHIDNLCEWIERLDLRDITLLAHDWGGAIGLGAAVQLPDRFDSIALFNTGAFPPPFVPLRIRACRTPLLGAFAIRGLNLFARAALWMAVESAESLDGAARQGLLAPYDSWRHRVGIDAFVRDIPLTRRHPTWATLKQLEDRLPSLAPRPIRLLWGMRDWCFDVRCLRRFQEIWPHARTHAFENAGHYVVEEAADRILPVVRQLAAEGPRSTVET